MLEFIEGDKIKVVQQMNAYPFAKSIIGVIKENEEGFYVFHSASNIVLSCKDLANISEYLSKLNCGRALGE